MTGGNNVNTQFYRSVKVAMNRREISRLRPFHRGLDINIYEPIVDGHNLLHLPGYNTKKIDWVDMTITARNINVQPLHERDMRDIDEELARLDSKWRILKDHLKHTDNPSLVHEKQPVETLTRHLVILDHPHLDGANDHWRSKAQDVHTMIMPMEEVKQLEERWEKRKAFFPTAKNRFMLKDVKKAPNEPVTNRPMVEVKVGII